MLYGNDELEKFHNHLREGNNPWPQYFEMQDINGRREAVVHKVVQRWIDHIFNTDPECSQSSAIRDLLRIVEQKLLVVQLKPRSEYPIRASPREPETIRQRATAREFRDSLDIILEKVKKDPRYLLTGNSREKLISPGIIRAYSLELDPPETNRAFESQALDEFPTERDQHTNAILKSRVGKVCPIYQFLNIIG